MRAFGFASSIACAALAAAQEPAPPAAAMERFARATHAIERHLGRSDRSDLVAALDEVAATARALREPAIRWPRPGAAAWLDELDRAVDLLREPGATPERDRWDFRLLRSACTGCHLEVRGDVAERGLFPNRDHAVSGIVRVELQSGEASAEHGGAVVFLDRDEPPAPPLPRAPAISQRGRRFHPSVLAVPVGTTVRFPNDDVVFHNVFSLSRGNAFDLDTYGKGQEKAHTMRNPGLVKVHCNIHPEMVAHVLVLRTTRTAVSNAAGFWVVPDVPAGDYTLRVWQPLAEVQSRPLRVGGGAEAPIEIVVRETRPRVQHTDKHGRPYKAKY